MSNMIEGLEEGKNNSRPGVTIEVSELTYGVLNEQRKVKRLLKHVNLTLQSGMMCALMGPSGAGKSTLLDLLADRKLVGTWSGEIIVDGQPRTDAFRLRTAYVLQDDFHIPTLTVEEVLYYSCWTRVAHLKTKEQIEGRVTDLLKMMGLDHVRKSIVGDPMNKGISGGQLKRLSIAVELVTLPDIVFLDEPTSGLDSSISLEVMSAVKELTGSSKLCISTIHQPSPEVFALFDKLVLMCSGRLVYFGNTMDCVTHFTSARLGYRYVKGTNPAEFVIAVGGGSQMPEGSKVPRQPEELEALYKASQYYNPRPLRSISKTSFSAAPQNVNAQMTSFATQTKMLISRNWLSKIRDTADMKAQLGKNIFVSILVGIVFYKQGDVSTPFYTDGTANAQVYNCSSILFFSMMYVMVGNLQAIPYLSMQNVIYRRELASNAYTTGPYWLSQILTVLPINFAFHTIFVVILYAMVKFPNDSEYFVYYWMLLFFGNVCAFYSAIWLAAQTGNQQLAFALFPILFLFLANFSGYAITLGSVPPFWCWAPYLSYARYVFEGLMVNQWGYYETDDATQANNYGNVLEQYDFQGFNKLDSFWILALFAAGFAGLAYFAMLPPRKRLVQLKPEDMTNSAALSFFEGKKKPNVSITAWNDPNTILRESLIGHDTTFDEMDEPLKPQVSYNVDFYRVSSGMIDKADGCHLTFSNVVYDVPNRSQPGETSRLLNNVSGQVRPGEMCALMGASGAGKSTLLDVLAGRKTTGQISGDILYNGNSKLRSSAYVMQDNVHIGLLTVKENLYFAAQLRLPEKWTMEKKEQRVKKIMDMLGLTPVANTLVGNETIRGISGGQMKRLSIGVEIVNLPNVMFLDEPTTGLDSSISFEVMAAVRNLANQNRTVICTIHQPSQTTFDLFDSLLLLAKGRVIYFGGVREAVEYFVGSPYQFYYKPNSNTADFVIAVAGAFIPASNGQFIPGDSLADFYQANKKHAFKPIDLTAPTTPTGGKILSQDELEESELELQLYNTSTAHQVKILCYRALLKTIKDRRVTVAATARHILVALFYGSLYFHLSGGTSSSAYSDRLGLFFFNLVFMTIGHQQMMPALIEDRLLFYRERGAKAYGGFTYWLSTWTVQIPFIFVNVLIFSIIIYFMVQLNSAEGAFGNYFYFVLATSFCGYFVANFIGSIAPSVQAALSYYPGVLLFSVSFSGFLVYIPRFPSWLGNWAPYISFLRYSFEGLVINEFKNNNNLPYGYFYLQELGFTSLSKSDCAGVIFVWILFYGFIFLCAIRFLNFEKR